ncbi:MAG: M1 family metallopeptidase [Longimicrobiales bacterium]|nr:M1 family metallopeptidase [Longimicrobiales bacterium]
MRLSAHPLAAALAIALAAAPSLAAQEPDPPVYTRADTLRGSWTTPARAWWDVTFYDLSVTLHPGDSTISGSNAITLRALEAGRELQIDLMTPLEIDSIVQDGHRLAYRREGNAFFATLPEIVPAGATRTLTVHYHGSPRVAARPPWDGGITWATDSIGRPWVVTTDQGIGASVWWPNKDTQADEPDSQRVAVRVPPGLVNVGPGRLVDTRAFPDGSTVQEWFARSPINNYAIALATGHYAHYAESYAGEEGELTLDFWPLDYHLEAARRQWAQVTPMLQCFEHWFGPFPWYEDGYKLVEVPHNGMEHQTAIAYGNGFANGYQGRDGSGTGDGLRWDFIIVHESAHEWWGNHVTTKDLADMWVHESFANYAESLYNECLFGREAGARYVIGTRRGIRNDRPIIPARGVNAQGSGDMYPKGGSMLHTIRQIVGDDARWRGILRGIQAEFGRRTVTGQAVRDYMSREAGIDLSKIFEQYLETVMIPVFEYEIRGDVLRYRWANVVPGFEMPVEVTLRDGGVFETVRPTTEWREAELTLSDPAAFAVDPDYYVEVRAGDAAPE